MKNIASEFYRKRLGNCAQAVAYAWKEKTDGTECLGSTMARFGSGRAPEGVCGAVYAAGYILGEDGAGPLYDKFRELHGGSIDCREIRGSHTLNCVECVEAAAELLEKEINSARA